MEKPERQQQCPYCSFIAHLSSFDNYKELAVYTCERCHKLHWRDYDGKIVG